ncbi:MAG: hypothetical protein IOC63_10915 [Methylobacterium sp.]|nr:hypothetical protein [Methylobacterium sp.]
MNSIDLLIPFLRAIEMAGMKSTRAYEEVKAGRLSIVKNGRRTFIRESEIRRYIDQLEKEGSVGAKRAA